MEILIWNSGIHSCQMRNIYMSAGHYTLICLNFRILSSRNFRDSIIAAFLFLLRTLAKLTQTFSWGLSSCERNSLIFENRKWSTYMSSSMLIVKSEKVCSCLWSSTGTETFLSNNCSYSPHPEYSEGKVKIMRENWKIGFTRHNGTASQKKGLYEQLG